MEATLLDIDFETELRNLQRERARDRSKGIHLSQIIHYIIEILEPKRFGGKEIDPALVHGGFIWEDVMSAAFMHQFGHTKQIEIQRDDIYMTLDGFSAKRWRVIEMKCTKMSARNPIRSRKFMHWHMQIMGYCLGMRTQEAELIPLFLNGAYELGGGRFGKPVVGMKGHPYLLYFTKRELIENWDWILRSRDEMLEDDEWLAEQERRAA